MEKNVFKTKLETLYIDVSSLFQPISPWTGVEFAVNLQAALQTELPAAGLLGEVIGIWSVLP